MPTIMTQLASDTSSEGRIDNALLTRNSISNRSGFASQPHADPSIPSEIFISPSRSRAMTESEVQKNQKPKHEKPKFASLHSPSCETRQILYTWDPFHKDPEMPKDQGSTSKPRYVEKASYADGESDPEPEGITPPTWDWGHQLTPVTNTSSESEHCEPQKVLASDNPDRDVRPKPEKLQIHSVTASEAIQDADASIKVDDWQSKGILPSGCSSGEDDDMEDDEYDLFESEDDSFEERWVSTDKEFEATVLHATGNDFSLAARLIPQLYQMFRQEESSVVGFWELCYRQRVGNSYGQGPREQGGRAEPRRSYAAPPTSLRKRLRENDEDDGEEADNNQDGDKNDDGNTEEHVGSPNSPPFACPFNKKYPSFYNGLHRSPDTRKGEYKTCQLGYDTEQRFKEHLSRLHRCIQCEKCSQKFTGPIKTREVNFQKHRSLGDCRNAPPDILEGLTELQWAEIKALPSQPRSAAAIGEPKARKLTVIRWNDVWQIIFPRENPPIPWCVPITEKFEHHSSSLEDERAEFKACFDSVINQENENLSHIDKATQAFELWWTKWQVKQESSRQTQYKLAQMTLQENKKTPTTHARDEQGLLNEPISFPNIKRPQRRLKIPEFQSHQEWLQNSPSGLEVQDMRSRTRRTSSGPHIRYQGCRSIGMPSQVSATQMLTEFTQPSGQNITYPSQHLNPMVTYEGIEQPVKAFPKTQTSFLGSEYSQSMAIEGIADFQSTSGDGSQMNTFTNVDMSRASHFQQPDPSVAHLQPQYPGNHQFQLQPQVFQHPRALISNSNTTDDQTYGSRPMQSQQAILPYSNQHPPQNFPQEGSHYDDGYD